jgi:hypothetical protein
MMVIQTNMTKTLTLLTLVCGLLLQLQPAEGWFFNSEEEEITTVSDIGETTEPQVTLAPSRGKQHHDDEDPNSLHKSHNETSKITSAVPTASEAASEEQDGGQMGGMFTTRKEGMVPPATEVSEEGELDPKRETELDVEFIVVTTPKNINGMESGSHDGHHGPNSASNPSKNNAKHRPTTGPDHPKIHNTQVVSEENEDTGEDASPELFMAVGGSGDIDEDLHEITTSRDFLSKDPPSEVSSEEETDDSPEEVTESIIVVHEEGSKLEASPEKYMTEEKIHPTEEPTKGDQNAVIASNQEEVTAHPVKSRGHKLTRRPSPGLKAPKPRKAPGAALDIPEKSTTMRNSAPPPESAGEHQLSTPKAQEVIIDHKNSTRTGLSLAAKTGIAAGCVVAFWLILGPIVCCLCKMKDTPKEVPPEPEKGEGANGALVEEMVITELARGRDKKYNTTVQNDQEITTLNQDNTNGDLKQNIEV